MTSQHLVPQSQIAEINNRLMEKEAYKNGKFNQSNVYLHEPENYPNFIHENLGKTTQNELNLSSKNYDWEQDNGLFTILIPNDDGHLKNENF